MLRGEGSYYTPISADGQVVEKHVDSIEVSRAEDRPTIVVGYTLTNPYDHPVVVPIQSGLTLLYEYQEDEEKRKPELHVVPATVTRHGDGEMLYVADDPGAVFGTTASQRHHLGTGIPNYRHPVAINVTLVPGDAIELEASARIPERVERMILVDAMVGPDQPYGIYPQLLKHPSSEGKVPPPLRVYEGASFQDNPPHVRMPEPGQTSRREKFLPRWLNPTRFARLQEALRHTGKLWSYAVTIAAVVLSASLILRLVLSNLSDQIAVEVVRTIVFAALGSGTIARKAWSRISFGVVLGLSGLLGLVQVGVAIVAGPIPASVLLTQATVIPILFLIGAAILLGSPAVRAYTNARQAPGGTRR